MIYKSFRSPVTVRKSYGGDLKIDDALARQWTRDKLFAGRNFATQHALANAVREAAGTVYLRPGEEFTFSVYSKAASLGQHNVNNPFVTVKSDRDIPRNLWTWTISVKPDAPSNRQSVVFDLRLDSKDPSIPFTSTRFSVGVL